MEEILWLLLNHFEKRGLCFFSTSFFFSTLIDWVENQALVFHVAQGAILLSNWRNYWGKLRKSGFCILAGISFFSAVFFLPLIAWVGNQMEAVSHNCQFLIECTFVKMEEKLEEKYAIYFKGGSIIVSPPPLIAWVGNQMGAVSQKCHQHLLPLLPTIEIFKIKLWTRISNSSV